MNRTMSFLGAATTVFGVALLIPTLPSLGPDEESDLSAVVPPLGNGDTVDRSYALWAAQYERGGGGRRLTLALGWSKALSARHTRAHGTARIDLLDGVVKVEAQGLPADVSDVWLVDNQPAMGDTVRPEAHDRYRYVGRLSGGKGEARLEAVLGPHAFRGFDVDLVAVVRNDAPPAENGVLFGAPTLFQRLHRRAERARMGLPVTPDIPPPLQRPIAAVWPQLLAAIRHPVVRADHDDDGLVAQGRRLFFQETFGGNGRTCGTCHPASNNLTIDASFIASLPPTDPLFVAEFIPALRVDFENPRLMRQAGLILENVDGFPQRGVMRGVPHTFALTLSLNPAPNDGSTVPPVQRTGWGGDGAPGAGSLREFATGAVMQHFTRTLARVANRDFRLPTDAELDAMEAFMLSLGRPADLDLSNASFKNTIVELGRRIFNNDGSATVAAGKCFRCHSNAGANNDGTAENGNFDTGVEDLPALPASLIDPANSRRDAGFGRGANAKGGFGDGKFNTPPLVEAADTGPFFHNNAVDTIEAAVSFYTSAAFAQSPSGQFLGPIQLAPTEVSAVASFLRVLNALENIRQASEEGERALTANNIHRARPHIGQAIEEAEDAVTVLRGAGLHPVAVQRLRQATESLRLAFDEHNPHRRALLINLAAAAEAAARSDMIQ